MARVGGVVKVTDELIALATQRDSSHCMVADALKAHFPHATDVLVDLQQIRYSDRKAGKRYVWLTPPAAQLALIHFDQGERVDAFSFPLRAPVQSRPIRSAGRKAGQPNKARRPHAAGPSKLISVEGQRPVRIGGPIPPVAVLSNARGRIRGFGLRQLKP